MIKPLKSQVFLIHGQLIGNQLPDRFARRNDPHPPLSRPARPARAPGGGLAPKFPGQVAPTFHKVSGLGRRRAGELNRREPGLGVRDV